MRMLLIEGSGRGFLSHYAHALALGLHQVGNDVVLLTGSRDELSAWRVPFKKVACLTSGWRAWLCLLRKVLKSRPDIVHLQWVDSPLAAWFFTVAAQRYGIRVLYTPHNILPHRRRWLAMPTFRALYRRVDRIVARDAQIAWGLEEILGISRTSVTLLTGSPNLMAHPDAPNRDLPELPRKLAGEFRLLYFGHGSPRKGLAHLLAAVSSRIWAERLHLVLAGEGVLNGANPALIRQACKHVRTTIVNRYVEPDEVGSLFTSTDLLVMPYLKLCKSPLTDLAVAFRLPVMRSDRVQGAYFREGIHGITVPCADPAILADAVSQIVDSPSLLSSLQSALAREDTTLTAIGRLADRHQILYNHVLDTADRQGRDLLRQTASGDAIPARAAANSGL